MAWSIKIHTADEEQGVATPPYDQVATVDLTALSNYYTTTLSVLGVEEQIDLEGEQIEYANGSIGASQRGRKSYTVTLYPIDYADRSTYTNLFTVADLNLAKAKYMWLEFYSTTQLKSTNVGYTNDYMLADSAIPVTLTGVSWSHNFDLGTKNLVLNFKRKYLLT